MYMLHFDGYHFNKLLQYNSRMNNLKLKSHFMKAATKKMTCYILKHVMEMK